MNRQPIKRRTALNKRGPKTREWDRVRASLKIEFMQRGDTACELRLPGCWRDNGLTFCHRVKRRFITTENELRVVCLGCMNCHRIIEDMDHAAMRNAVESAIALSGRMFPTFLNDQDRPR